MKTLVKSIALLSLLISLSNCRPEPEINPLLPPKPELPVVHVRPQAKDHNSGGAPRIQEILGLQAGNDQITGAIESDLACWIVSSDFILTT